MAKLFTNKFDIQELQVLRLFTSLHAFSLINALGAWLSNSILRFCTAQYILKLTPIKSIRRSVHVHMHFPCGILVLLYDLGDQPLDIVPDIGLDLPPASFQNRGSK